MKRRNKDISWRPHITAPDDDNIIIARPQRRRKLRIAAFIINFEYWRAICLEEERATQLATKSHNIVALIRFGGRTMTSATAAAIRIKLHQVVIVRRSLDARCSDQWYSASQAAAAATAQRRSSPYNCVWRIERATATAVEGKKNGRKDGLSQRVNDDDDYVKCCKFNARSKTDSVCAPTPRCSRLSFVLRLFCTVQISMLPHCIRVWRWRLLYIDRTSFYGVLSLLKQNKWTKVHIVSK